jgi:hypothetical protein
VHWSGVLPLLGHVANKPIQTFTHDSFSGPLPQLHTPSYHHSSHMPTRRVGEDEGLDHSSLARCPAVMLKGILPTQLSPRATNMISFDYLNPASWATPPPTASTPPLFHTLFIQIGEWKYCTDNNLKDTHYFIMAKYPPCNALCSRWLGTHADIIPIVTTRTCTPHSLTYAGINFLINCRNNPLDRPSQTPTRDTARIISHLHIHSVQ